MLNMKKTVLNECFVCRTYLRSEYYFYGEYPIKLTAPYSAPKKWVERLDFVADVNASVSVPQSLSYPVYHVSYSALPQTEADHFIEYFLSEMRNCMIMDKELSLILTLKK